MSAGFQVAFAIECGRIERLVVDTRLSETLQLDRAPATSSYADRTHVKPCKTFTRTTRYRTLPLGTSYLTDCRIL